MNQFGQTERETKQDDDDEVHFFFVKSLSSESRLIEKFRFSEMGFGSTFIAYLRRSYPITVSAGFSNSILTDSLSRLWNFVVI